MARPLDRRDWGNGAIGAPNCDVAAAAVERPPTPDPMALGRRLAVEWPTVGVLGLCYGLWLCGLALAAATPGAWSVLALLVLVGPAVALHASLQHEVLHGHPTRSAAVNEALVFASLNLCLPYRRFKTLHLRHHRNERLTDPYEDPESFYVAEGDWAAASPALRAVLRANATLLGRLLLGPWLSVIGLWRMDARAAWRDRRMRATLADAYLRHALGAGLTLTVVWGVFGVSPLVYLLVAAWPGLAFLMLRSFAEHRAAERVGARTAIVEAEAPLALLFLNNNLHAVHHENPTLAWHRLPAVWRRERARLLADNDGYLIRGYRELAQRWLLTPKEPVVHPILRRAPESVR